LAILAAVATPATAATAGVNRDTAVTTTATALVAAPRLAILAAVATPATAATAGVNRDTAVTITDPRTSTATATAEDGPITDPRTSTAATTASAGAARAAVSASDRDVDLGRADVIGGLEQPGGQAAGLVGLEVVPAVFAGAERDPRSLPVLADLDPEEPVVVLEHALPRSHRVSPLVVVLEHHVTTR
jgi:hypothetical protein